MKIDAALVERILATVDAGICRGLGSDQTPGHMCVEAAVCYALGLPHGDNPQCVDGALRRLKISLNDSEWSSNAARAKGLRRLAIAQLGTSKKFDHEFFAQQVAQVARGIVGRCKIGLDTCASTRNFLMRADAAVEVAESIVSSADVSSCSVYTSVQVVRLVSSVEAARWDEEVKCDEELVAEKLAEAEAADESADVDYPEDDRRNQAAYTARQAYLHAYWSADATIKARDAAADKVRADFAEAVVQILVEMKTPGSKWLHLTNP